VGARPERPAAAPAGTGYLIIKRDKSGREVWYGQWRIGVAKVKRKIGAKREREAGQV
jgi:hypothetical protein